MRGGAVILSLLTTAVFAAEGGSMEKTFKLPQPLADDAVPNLEVEVGPLAPGQRVRVTTPSGQLVGTISPFGREASQRGAVYTLPVPREAIRDGALATRVTIVGAGAPPRAPTATELRGVKLVMPKSP